MNQEVATGDIIFGAIVLVLFLTGALAVGRLLSGVKNRRFARAWAPLAPLIGGTIVPDGGGAASSWLTGTIGGRQVRASMVPGRNRYQEAGGERFNDFEVALVELAGRDDWRIEQKRGVLGQGAGAWRVVTENRALAARLEGAGVVAALAGLGLPAAAYAVRARTLSIGDDVTPRWAPPPARFEALLALLLALAAIHEELNGA